MSRPLSLAPLTISLPLPDVIRAGFEAVGLRLPGTEPFDRVRDAGARIPGPSAAVTDAASGFYPAGGINLGPALTLGFIAGRHAAGANA